MKSSVQGKDNLIKILIVAFFLAFISSTTVRAEGSTQMVPTDSGGIVPPSSNFSTMNRKSLTAKSFKLEREGEDSGTVVIDLLVLYTKGFAHRYGGELNSKINSLVNVANLSYSNSKIHMKARIVGKKEMAYTDDGSLDTALEDVTYGKGAFSGITALREKVGADLVVLLRVYQGPDSNPECGRAWQMQTLSDDFKQWAYSVVQVGSFDTGKGFSYACGDHVLVHEMGHNMGSNHNGGDYGLFSYSLGNRFGAYRSIMSYQINNEERISYFSNPDVSYKSHKTGTPGLNNALSLENARLVISRWFDSPVPFAPIISFITPKKGHAGKMVIIRGKNFAKLLKGNSVKFNGKTARVLRVNATGTVLKVKVPFAAKSGPIAVTVNGDTGASEFNFVVEK